MRWRIFSLTFVSAFAKTKPEKILGLEDLEETATPLIAEARAGFQKVYAQG